MPPLRGRVYNSCIWYCENVLPGKVCMVCTVMTPLARDWCNLFWGVLVWNLLGLNPNRHALCYSNCRWSKTLLPSSLCFCWLLERMVEKKKGEGHVGTRRRREREEAKVFSFKLSPLARNTFIHNHSYSTVHCLLTYRKKGHKHGFCLLSILFHIS
jgi:hypothetical protein